MSRFPKLTETFILYEILAMEKLGVPIEIYPLLRERARVVHAEASRLIERTHYHPFLSWPIIRAQWHFIRRRPFAYFKVLAEILRGTFGSINFFIGAIGIFPKSVRFAYEMERKEITHVHAHFATHPTVAALIIHRLTGIPFSFTAHGSDLHVERRMLDKKVEAAAFAVTISSFNKKMIVNECGEDSRGKVHVIHCGTDSQVFFPCDKKNSDGVFRLLCVASFEEVKGHQYLVEACRLLRERGVDLVCDLVGEGPTRRDIEKQIAQARLEKTIIVHGGRNREDVAGMLRSADVKVLASVPTRSGKREGIPVVLMEAMASALPVVASSISGIPELVDDGHSGLLVPPRDTVALTEALQRLHGDPALRYRMGVAGREKVMREFNLSVNTAKRAELFLQHQAVLSTAP